jgi:hypothetical protein
MYLSNYFRPCGANVEASNGQDQNAVPLALANTRMTVSKKKKNLLLATWIDLSNRAAIHRLFSVLVKGWKNIS